jgi:hypothetical protein
MNKKIIIMSVLVVAVVTGAVFYLYGYYSNNRSGQNVLVTQSEPKDGDYACTGKSHENYELGFGVKHVYKGSINSDMPVAAVLSCDHTYISIYGSVEQVIYAAPTVERYGYYELADLVAGTEVISIDSDINSDGYKDLVSVVQNGSAVEHRAVFLYDSTGHQFEFSGVEKCADTCTPAELYQAR